MIVCNSLSMVFTKYLRQCNEIIPLSLTFLIKEKFRKKYSLKFPLGIYTLPDGVLTKHDGSKSTPKSFGLPAKRPLFIRFIVGFLGGTSGGAVGVTPSRREPENREIKFN